MIVISRPGVKLTEKQEKNKLNYLYNLGINGLILEKHFYDNHEYVLVEVPSEKLLEIAEKIRLKLPIETNNLNKENLTDSFWDKFECFIPNEIKENNERRNYFTAPYEYNQREK